MQVIAKVKGFDGKKIRQPGEKFEWHKPKCPSWMVPVNAGDPTEDSTACTDMDVKKAAAVIAKLDSVEKVEAFASGDPRKTVVAAAEARIAELSA